MNTIRIDRVQHPQLGMSAPCGMNSIIYIGDNMHKALKVFHSSSVGKDAWNNADTTYGVSLSIWNGSDFTAKLIKV
jgi:hypothetical protein